MYERFFGFEEAPFRLTPDPRYLFLSAKHREALGHLVYGLREGAGFVAITGEIGAGKTTLLRSFLSDPPGNARYAYILNPVLTGVELLQEINHELGIAQEGTQRDLLVALNAFLLAQKQEGNQVVLVIDEAQALGGAILEQLRMLSNFETETAKLLQIVLVGQPELRDLLRRADLEQLDQRITVRWHLGPLDRSETAQYVAHRLATASGGRARRIFTGSAMGRIHSYTRGVPRRINVLCHRALLVAYARDRTVVNRRVVNLAIDEIERPKQSEPLREWRFPRWSIPVAAATALCVAGGIAWQRGLLPSGIGGWTIARTTASEAPVDRHERAGVARALDAVGGGASGGQAAASGSSGPRVAAEPLTPVFEPWSGSADPAFEPATEPAMELAAPSSASVVPSAASIAPASAPVSEPDLAPAPLADNRWVDRATLVDAIRQTTPGESAYQAVEALLGVWSTTPLSASEASRETLDLPSIATLRNLRYLEFAGNLSSLRVLDLPAILELDVGDGSRVHFAMVDQVDDDRARVTVGRASFAVSHTALSELWFGQAHLLWYDAHGLGPILARGSSGRSVAQLHDLLRGAGVYAGRGGNVFAADTEEAVVEFQRSAHLNPDGKVGPMTMIALYRLVSTDWRPRLAAGESPEHAMVTRGAS